MKKFVITLVLFTLTSCGGYESLNTPFKFSGKGINLFGSDAAPSTEQSNTFEVVVNAPAGTTGTTAMGLFDQEANRVCQGKEFTKIITSSGSVNIRNFGEKGLDTSSAPSPAPSIKGFVTCK